MNETVLDLYFMRQQQQMIFIKTPHDAWDGVLGRKSTVEKKNCVGEKTLQKRYKKTLQDRDSI